MELENINKIFRKHVLIEKFPTHLNEVMINYSKGLEESDWWYSFRKHPELKDEIIKVKNMSIGDVFYEEDGGYFGSQLNIFFHNSELYVVTSKRYSGNLILKKHCRIIK